MTGSGAATLAKELVSLADTTFSTGLIERSAAAFASGMPEGPGDDSFFGPASVTWRVSADLGSPVAALRSLLLQALCRGEGDGRRAHRRAPPAGAVQRSRA